MKNYFSHDSNARNSDKLIRVRMKYGAEGYGAYFMILERLRDEDDYTSIADYDMIAYDLRCDRELVRSVIEDFSLFVIDEERGIFYSSGLINRMSLKDENNKAKSGAGKRGMATKWGKSSEAHATRSERLRIARDKGTHTSEEWNEMKEFFGECVICGSTDRIVKDHITPIYQGGSDSITNLQPLCKSCSSRKGADCADHRLEWCQAHDVEMPNKWLTDACQTPNKRLTEIETPNNVEKTPETGVFETPNNENHIKESKGKESKGKDNNKLSPPPAREGESPPSIFALTLEQCQADLLARPLWQEQFVMNTRAAGYTDFSPDDFLQYLALFFAKLQNEGEQSKSPKDAMSHFARWIKNELNSQKNNETKKQHPDSRTAAPGGKKSAGIKSFSFS